MKWIVETTSAPKGEKGLIVKYTVDGEDEQQAMEEWKRTKHLLKIRARTLSVYPAETRENIQKELSNLEEDIASLKKLLANIEPTSSKQLLTHRERLLKGTLANLKRARIYSMSAIGCFFSMNLDI